MPVNSAQFRMADQLAGGELESTIREYRTTGLSFDAIAARLYADHRIEVTGNTVRAWIAQFAPLPDPSEATA